MSKIKEFAAFKKRQIDENEKKYGNELSTKYDAEFLNQTRQKYLKKSKYEMEVHEKLTKKLNETIKNAMDVSDPSSEIATRMCELHKEWLCFYWPSYNEESHLALVRMYTQDERFTKYYDKIRVGAAEFLYAAMQLYMTK